MSIAAMLYGPVSSPVDGTRDSSSGPDVLSWFSSLSDDAITVVQIGVVILGAVMAVVLFVRARGGLAGPVGVLVGAIALSWLISHARGEGARLDPVLVLWIVGGLVLAVVLVLGAWIGLSLLLEGREKRRAAAAKAPAVAKSPPVEAAAAAEAPPAAEKPAPSLVKPASVVSAPAKKSPAVRPEAIVPPKAIPVLKGWTVERALASLPAIDRGRPSWRHAVLAASVLALALFAGGVAWVLVDGRVGGIVAGVTLVAMLPLARLVWRRLRRTGGEDSTEFYAAHDAAVQFANAAAVARSDAAAFAFWVAMFDAHLVSHPELDRGVWAPEFSRLRRTGLLSSSNADDSA